MCADAHQSIQDNYHATVVYHDVAKVMVVKVASVEVSHVLLYNNDNGMRSTPLITTLGGPKFLIMQILAVYMVCS